ncbi:MAG: EamA family transporter [Candidatus Omnitrophica bacterium]|nr:EamA family transporter [Candidatus Omnitrophota bacterium]
MSVHWQLYALGSAFFAGVMVVFSKWGVADISSNLATLIRTVVITIFLVTLILIRGEWVSPLTLSGRTMVFLILSGLATGLSWICYFRALQLGPASMVVPVDKLSLVFAVLFAVLFLGEHLSWQQWAGVAVMTFGALLVIGK